MIFKAMRRYKPGIQHMLGLRKGLSLMNSKPEFELFVQTILRHNGFEVTPNRILQGKCVEHEVDAIAKKDGITYFVEAKHHSTYHTPTGLDESRIAQAVLEDATDGFMLGKNDLKINGAMIVTNTRFSEQARRYGACKNILQIGWDSPENLALQNMIEQKKLYPLSCLNGLGDETRTRLVNSGVVLLKQLIEEKPSILARKAKLPQKTVTEIAEKAQASLKACSARTRRPQTSRRG
jgi:Holliday junction resolvase-like predicted endonuclease